MLRILLVAALLLQSENVTAKEFYSGLTVVNKAPTKWQRKLPMLITNFRMALVPVIVGALVPQTLFWDAFAALFFIIASVSDYYDGYFARKYNAVSNMGKFMDPIADKILVTSILVMLVPLDKIDPIMVIVILARDTLISGLRQVAAADQIIISAQASGKWKTALQMVAIPAVIIGEKAWGIPFDKIGYWVLWASTVLSVTSGIQYVLGYQKAIRLTKKSALADAASDGR